ncbi:MAG: restriction endonuclease subunit S [Eggerthellaceae bacterium]
MKLNEICSKGKSSLRQKDVINDGPYSVYGASGVVGTTSDYQNEIPYVAVIKDGAGVGRASACEPMTSVLGTMQALIPNPNVERDYLLYLVRSLRLGEGFSGSTIPHIYFKDYGKIEVSLPSLEAQKRIVSQLGLIEAQIEQAEAQTTQLDQLVKSRFVEMFGDPVTAVSDITLGEVANMKAGKTTTAKTIHDVYAPGLYPCYGGNGFRGYSAEPTHEGVFPLIGRQGALCGNVQIAHGTFRATEHAVVVDCKTSCEPVWLFHYLKYDNLGRLATGAAQPGLSLKDLKLVPVQLPPKDRQVEFISFVSQVDKSRFVRDHEINFR